MLSLIIAGFSILGGILLLFFKPTLIKEIKATAIFIAVIVCSGCLLTLFPETQKSQLIVNSQNLFTSNLFSSLTSIVVSLLFLISFFAADTNTNSEHAKIPANFPDTISRRTRIFYVFILIFQGISLMLISCNNLLLTSIFLILLVLLLFFIVVNNKPKHQTASLKMLIYQLIGCSSLLFSSFLVIAANDVETAFIFFILSMIFLLPLIPFSTYISDIFENARKTSGLVVIVFHMIIYYILLKFCSAVFLIEAKSSGFCILLPLLSLFSTVISAKAQKNLTRQFSYALTFMSALIALSLFLTISEETESFLGYFSHVKLLVLAAPIILALFWLQIIRIKNSRTGFLIPQFSGILLQNKTQHTMFLVATFFLIAFPLTPMFFALFNIFKIVLMQKFSVVFIFLPLNVIWLVLLTFTAFLLHVYWILDLYRKLARENSSKPENYSNNIKDVADFTKNDIFISSVLLILLLFLSIFPFLFLF